MYGIAHKPIWASQPPSDGLDGLPEEVTKGNIQASALQMHRVILFSLGKLKKINTTINPNPSHKYK